MQNLVPGPAVEDVDAVVVEQHWTRYGAMAARAFVFIKRHRQSTHHTEKRKPQKDISRVIYSRGPCHFVALFSKVVTAAILNPWIINTFQRGTAIAAVWVILDSVLQDQPLRYLEIEEKQ